MANESWAGGTISGGADATAWSLKARGGLIPVADVPNAPKTVAMPTVGNYPKVPNIRLDYPQKAPDMSSRAKKLQQEPLPSSFSEAGSIRTEAAGKGQMAVGKAISGLGEDIASASSSITNVLGQLAAKEADVRDAAAKIKAEAWTKDYNKRVEDIIKYEQPEEWKGLVQEESKKLHTLTDGLGARKSTNEIIQAQVAAVTQTAEGQHLVSAGLLKSMTDNAAFGAELERAGTEEKDYAKRDKGIWLQDKAGSITPDQAKERYDRTGYLQGLDAIEVAKKTPQGAMKLRDEAKKVSEADGKYKSEEFKALNTNPKLAPNIQYDAEQALKSHKANDLQDIKARIENGELNTDAKIEAATKGRAFSPETVEGLKRVDKYVPYSSTAHAEVRQLLNKYDYNTDKSGENYEDIWNQIQWTVDKEHRGIYESVLNEKMKKGVAGKPDSALETAGKVTKKKIEGLSKANMLPSSAEERADLISAKSKIDVLEKGIDPNTKKPLTAAQLKDPKFNLTVKEKAAWEKNGATEIQLLDATDDFIKNNPDAAPGKLDEEILKNHPVSADIEKNAGSATDSAPRAGKVDVVERERRLAEARSTPTGMGAVPPRELNKPSPSFQKAMGGGGQSSDVRATAYTKFEPGGDKVASRKGPLNTMELYQQGKVPYVSAAMDDKSEFQGKFVVYSAHPNVVFKVEDRGGEFVGKGNSAIDIAYDNRDMENAYETSGTIKAISAEEAAEISGAKNLTTAGGPTSAGPIQITSAVDPSYAAMSRPRNVSQISKIVVHGDVKTSVPDLISYAKQVDRGYHYYIATNGTITMAVPPDHIANHIKGANSDSIGIVIAGADNGKMPTPAQDAAAKLLISQLGKQYGIDPKNVAGHGERQPNRRDVREGGNVAKDIRENGFV